MHHSDKQQRLVVLDYLRGYFIIVIIIDHLSRWPSVFSYITGQALLWITAAEGFVIISGLLVGYIRGYKDRLLPMVDVTKKLLKRALLLYIASIIATFIYTVIMWYIRFPGGAPGLPIAQGDFQSLLFYSLTLQYTYVWVHFLTLYAIYLAIAPLAIWLMRKGKSWLVIGLSLSVLAMGWQTDNQVMQWQALFFIPSVAGFYLPSIQSWWRSKNIQTQHIISFSIIGFTVATIIISALITFTSLIPTSLGQLLDTFFAKDTISLSRLLLAFVWFVGFLFACIAAKPWISQWFHWLLHPIGTRSLSAYIIHGLAICIISLMTVASDSIIINTFLGITCVGIVWTFLKIPFVQKIIPR